MKRKKNLHSPLNQQSLLLRNADLSDIPDEWREEFPLHCWTFQQLHSHFSSSKTCHSQQELRAWNIKTISPFPSFFLAAWESFTRYRLASGLISLPPVTTRNNLLPAIRSMLSLSLKAHVTTHMQELCESCTYLYRKREPQHFLVPKSHFNCR